MTLPTTLTADDAKSLIAQIVAQGGRVAFKQHAYDRMEERHITEPQVYSVLKTGCVVGKPEWSSYQNWKVTMKGVAIGEPVTVEAAIEEDAFGQSVLVVTAY
jgi:hypothetical protein